MQLHEEINTEPYQGINRGNTYGEMEITKEFDQEIIREPGKH